jgi:acyl-CoA thioesterase-1
MFGRTLLFLLLFGWAVSASGQSKILVLGDSLSAAYGIPVKSGWVTLLQDRLRDQGYPYDVVNASVSGETTTGGLARLPKLLDQHQPAVVLIELGGNDGLRGQPVKLLRANLRRMVTLSRSAGAQPVLFEIQIPANYGGAYVTEFQHSFREVADTEKIRVVPFFLAPVALDAQLMQADGIHPGVAAQPRMLEAVWPILVPMLRKNQVSK